MSTVIFLSSFLLSTKSTLGIEEVGDGDDENGYYISGMDKEAIYHFQYKITKTQQKKLGINVRKVWRE